MFDLLSSSTSLAAQVSGAVFWEVGRDGHTSVGSGFVIHPAGYIVTNAHVVAPHRRRRKVIFADKTEYDALVWSPLIPKLDLACAQDRGGSPAQDPLPWAIAAPTS